MLNQTIINNDYITLITFCDSEACTSSNGTEKAVKW